MNSPVFMNVLIVGAGAREHALAWRINQSPALTRLWTAPGNFGTSGIATNLDVDPADVDAVSAAARTVKADLVVVGPEAPLAGGLADRLALLGVPVFGPSQAAAQIESSKAFALELMRTVGVPCPEFHVFHDQAAALSHLKANNGPKVVKADGLAAGKGVMICADATEAAAAVRSCMSGQVFGDAGSTVVLEELLTGPEISVFAFTDGEHIAPLVAACDYKRLGDGDLGPNTGGMGSFAQPDFWSPELAQEIELTIMRPVVAAMAKRGTPYRGVLYGGLMLTEGGPKVLEFNCRLGDPETQVVIPLLSSDPVELMLACSQGNLDRLDVCWTSRKYVGVVMASGGYPDRYDTGFEISGLDQESSDDTMVFHAGTNSGAGGGPGANGGAVTSGGRILTVVGGGESMAEARDKAYRRLADISFKGAQWRTDIGAENDRSRTWSPGRAAARG